jgi:hypothetical protein
VSDWLKGLKVGDEVVFQDRDVYEVAPVEAVTAQSVTVCGYKFNRKTGDECGNPWRASYIYEATPEERENVIRRPLKYKLDSLSRREWQGVTTDQLERICAILDEPKEPSSE